MKRKSTLTGRFALTGAAAAALSLAVSGASALGLGRLQVQSSLGEGLRAEIDVTSLTPEEAASLRVRIAQPEAYRAAGVDYNPVLPSSEVSLQRRADGRPFLRISSDRGVQEPFVDMILEMNWSAGRLVREYTLLFDPPATARASPSSTATLPTPTTSALIAAAPMPAAPPAPAALAIERRSRVRAQPSDAPAAPPAPTSRPTAAAAAPSPARVPAAVGGNAYTVQPGDSLSRIAARTEPAGASLDQMLAALYRSNPDAFINRNINRLKADVVLAIPGADTAKALSTAEAHQLIIAQSVDFGTYRERLAGAVPAARPEGSDRQSSGKVDATVTDRQQGAAPPPDRLTLSKSGAAGKAADEQRLSREREKAAADTRVAELAKNVDELKKLSSAASQPQATPPVAAATPAPAPAPAVPAPAPAPVPVPTSAAPVAAVPAPAVAIAVPVPASAPVVVGAAAASAALQGASRVAAASAPLPVPAPAEPGFIGSLIDDNPLALGIGALAVLALGGFAAFRYGKRGKRDSGETSFLESRLQPDSFFGASGGQRIDTRDAPAASSSMSYSLSQLDAIGDVDPVAEADVYLAYGRDLQAEEILKEAMRSNPDRMAIRTKLLEVYAKRRDTKGFELLATQLFSLTKGAGEDWAKAQELGQQLDPDNPLYRPGGAPELARTEGGKVVEPLGASTMPQSVLPASSEFDAADGGESEGLGLDLDLGEPGLGTSPSPLEATQAFKPDTPFSRRPQRTVEDDAMSLDFSMPDLGVPNPTPSAVRRYDEPAPFDLSDISLDLDLPESSLGSETTTPRPGPTTGFADIDLPSLDGEAGGDDEPLARKLELADEFRQIGDSDGARDLLQEVISKATGSLKTRAQGMLADLG